MTNGRLKWAVMDTETEAREDGMVMVNLCSGHTTEALAEKAASALRSRGVKAVVVASDDPRIVRKAYTPAG